MGDADRQDCFDSDDSDRSEDNDSNCPEDSKDPDYRPNGQENSSDDSDRELPEADTNMIKKDEGSDLPDNPSHFTEHLPAILRMINFAEQQKTAHAKGIGLVQTDIEGLYCSLREFASSTAPNSNNFTGKDMGCMS